MKRKYNIPDLLSSLIGYKAVPFPGGYTPRREEGDYSAGPYHIPESRTSAQRQELVKGTRLYKQDLRGRWYFMPVYIHHKSIAQSSDAGDGSEQKQYRNENTLELQNAVVSVKGKKNIVETAMVGRKGTVKELINISDYTINVTAFIQSSDGSYPEEEITRIRDLYNINESVELISVLTDLVLDEGDKVVITNIEYPVTPGIEDGQAIKFECVTDKEFELTIDQ